MLNVILATCLLAHPQTQESDRTAELEVIETIQSEQIAPEEFLERTLLEHKLEGNPESTLIKLRALRLVMGTGQGKALDLEWLIRVTGPQFELLVDLGRYTEAEALLAQPIPSEEDLMRFRGIRAIVSNDTEFGQTLTASWRGSEAHANMREQLERRWQKGDVPAFLEASLDPWAIDWLRREVGLPQEGMVETAIQLLDNKGMPGGDLWRRFLPSLCTLAFMEAQGKGLSLSYDAYGTLVRLDSALAGSFTQTALPHGAGLWRRNVVDYLPVTNNGSHWISLGPWTERTRYHQPLWVDVLAELYSERPDDPRLREFVRMTIGYEGHGGRLESVIQELLRSGSAEELQPVLADIGSNYTSMAPVYAAGVENGDAGVREHCMMLLAQNGEQDLLARAVRDGVEGARPLFAQSLVSHQNRGGEETNELVRQLLIGPDEDAALAVARSVFRGQLFDVTGHFIDAALASPHESVRVRVAWQIMRSEGLDDETYTRLARDESPLVRAKFLENLAEGEQIRHLPLLISTVEGLIEDPTLEVRQALDVALASGDFYLVNSGLGDDDIRELILERVRRGPDPFEPFGGGLRGWSNFIERYGRFNENQPFLVRCGFLLGSDSMIEDALDRMAATREGPGLLDGLEPEVMEYLLRTCSSKYMELLEGTNGWSDYAELIERLSKDESLSSYRRLWALGRFPIDRGDESSRILMGILRLPTGPDDLRHLILPRIREGANEMLREVYGDSSIAAPIRAAAVSWYRYDSQDAWSTAKPILEDWFEEGAPYSPRVREILRTLHDLPATPDLTELLIRLLEVPDLNEVEWAVGALRGHQSPDIVGALGSVLARRDLHKEGSTQQVALQIKVTRAILATGSVEALTHLQQALLVAASPEVVQEMESAIARLREYLAGGEAPGGGLPSRKLAEVRLVDMLDSPSETIRIEAIRGLGTLGAVEALPVLIPLLEDPSERVKYAARDALNRLHGSSFGSTEKAEEKD